jgi:hypothetical protein
MVDFSSWHALLKANFWGRNAGAKPCDMVKKERARVAIRRRFIMVVYWYDVCFEDCLCIFVREIERYLGLTPQTRTKNSIAVVPRHLGDTESKICQKHLWKHMPAPTIILKTSTVRYYYVLVQYFNGNICRYSM